ncbi:MAG: hypothetical protein P1V51_02455 [Deltaproteobacteria bacterium]|nr:hypothetical protein [Deltaproteobacteria bacterium]
MKVRKHLVLLGEDEHELLCRIVVFRQALREREGAILDLRWHLEEGRAPCCVLVLYQIAIQPCACSRVMERRPN